jgi:hypothetical protein
MQRLSSFINNNYASPNIKDIENARRRREIDEIDQNLQRNKIGANKTHGLGEINEQHRTLVDKIDFRKSHDYKGSPRRSPKKNNILRLNIQLMSNRIDECSHD